MNSEDMRVLQAGREPDFTLEAFGTESRRELGMQDLKGHLAVVPQVVRDVDRGHAAAPELMVEAVAVANSGTEPREEVRHVLR
jgi:hypothetical protein